MSYFSHLTAFGISSKVKKQEPEPDICICIQWVWRACKPPQASSQHYKGKEHSNHIQLQGAKPLAPHLGKKCRNSPRKCNCQRDNFTQIAHNVRSITHKSLSVPILNGGPHKESPLETITCELFHLR